MIYQSVQAEWILLHTVPSLKLLMLSFLYNVPNLCFISEKFYFITYTSVFISLNLIIPKDHQSWERIFKARNNSTFFSYVLFFFCESGINLTKDRVSAVFQFSLSYLCFLFVPDIVPII